MPENENRWYVDMQNEIVGPVSLDMLRDWFRVKTITSETWVRQEGQSEWMPLAMVEELDMSEGDTADLEELADQPDAEKPLHYLRTEDMTNIETSERDQLLNRAFGVKCIAVVTTFLGSSYVFCVFAASVIVDRMSPLMAMLICGLLAIPIAIQYYLLNSIVASLRAIVKLMDRLDEREKSQEIPTEADH